MQTAYSRRDVHSLMHMLFHSQLFFHLKSTFLCINSPSLLNSYLVFHWMNMPQLGCAGISNIFLLQHWNRDYFYIDWLWYAWILGNFFSSKKISQKRGSSLYCIYKFPLPDAFWFLHFKQGSTTCGRYNSLKRPQWILIWDVYGGHPTKLVRGGKGGKGI